MDLINGHIRKISIGDLKTGMSYCVGTKLLKNSEHEMEIDTIMRDEAYFNKYNRVKYDIFVKTLNKQVRLWKSFQDMPISIEYYTND